jgi:hypothetical protein
MAKIRYDRVKEVSLSQGTGDFALLGTGTGFVTFASVCADGDVFDYSITNPGTNEWETGVGSYDSGANAVVRTTVTASSNSGNLVNFGAGNKQVFITVNSSSFDTYDKGISSATALAIALGG